MADRAERRVLLGGLSDERLVTLARAGDEQAFATIVERYRAPLLRYCHRFLSPAAVLAHAGRRPRLAVPTPSAS